MVSAVPPPVTGTRRDEGNGVGNYFRNVYRSVTSIVEGLGVTFSWMFRRPMTVQYPDKLEKPIQEMLPESYRGILENDIRLCTGCALCEKTCPIACITMNVAKNADGVRELTQFDIDIAKCMFCGLCVEACTFDALIHTNEFEACMPRIDRLNLRFVDTPVPVAKGRGKSPARAKSGEIVRGLVSAYGRRPRGPQFVAPPEVKTDEPDAAPVEKKSKKEAAAQEVQS